MASTNCDMCVNYIYDEDYECYTCLVNLDEDEMYRILTSKNNHCPFYRQGDDYTLARRQ